MKNATKLSTISLALLLSACGGGGGNTINSDSNPSNSGNTNTNANVMATGVVSPVIEGAYYQTPTTSGVIDSTGKYQYRSGEQVRISVGNVLISSAQGGSVISPIDPANPTEAKNMARLLRAIQTNSDGDGSIIKVPSSKSSNPQPVSVSSEADLEEAAKRINSNAVIPADTNEGVKNILAKTYKKLDEISAPKSGTYTLYNSESATTYCTDPLATQGTVTLNGSVNFESGTMSAAIDLLLSDGTALKQQITNIKGVLTASNKSFSYEFTRSGAPRLIKLSIRNSSQSNISCLNNIVFRDVGQRNLPPKADIGAILSKLAGSESVVDSNGGITILKQYIYSDVQVWISPKMCNFLSLGRGGNIEFNSNNLWIGGGGVCDPDGSIAKVTLEVKGGMEDVSLEWKKGDTKKKLSTTISYLKGQSVQVTLTAVDDDGVQSVDKFSIGEQPNSSELLKMFDGKILAANSWISYNGGPDQIFWTLTPLKPGLQPSFSYEKLGANQYRCTLDGYVDYADVIGGLKDALPFSSLVTYTGVFFNDGDASNPDQFSEIRAITSLPQACVGLTPSNTVGFDTGKSQLN